MNNAQEMSIAYAAESWLESATAQLCPAAKERIRADIFEHLEEAVRHYTDTGMEHEVAVTRALRELGSARLAARTFRKTYLTNEEADILDPDRSVLLDGLFTIILMILLLNAVSGLVFMALRIPIGSDGVFYSLLSMVSFLLCLPYNRKVRQTFYQPRRIKPFVYALTFASLAHIWILYGIYEILPQTAGPPSGAIVHCIIFSAFVAGSCFGLLRILKKCDATFGTGPSA